MVEGGIAMVHLKGVLSPPDQALVTMGAGQAILENSSSMLRIF